MKPSTASSFISVTLVVGFVVTSSLLLLAPVLGTGVVGDEALSAFKTYFNTVGGVVGVVVGFYFGRQGRDSGTAS